MTVGATASVSTSIVMTANSALSPGWSGSRRIGSVFVNGVHGEVDVVAAVELGTVGAVHLAPAGRAVGRQPQVGFVEVAEQQELAHLPRRRQADHVVDLLAADLPDAVQASFSQRSVSSSTASSSHVCPPGGEAVGRERGVDRHAASVPLGRVDRRYGAVP